MKPYFFNLRFPENRSSDCRHERDPALFEGHQDPGLSVKAQTLSPGDVALAFVSTEALFQKVVL